MLPLPGGRTLLRFAPLSRAALAGVGLRAGIAVVAGGAVGLETVVRAGGASPRAVLRRVALIHRRPTLGRRGLEGVGGAGVAAPVAGRGGVAVAGPPAALPARGPLRVPRAGRGRPGAPPGPLA